MNKAPKMVKIACVQIADVSLSVRNSFNWLFFACYCCLYTEYEASQQAQKYFQHITPHKTTNNNFYMLNYLG